MIRKRKGKKLNQVKRKKIGLSKRKHKEKKKWKGEKKNGNN